LHIIIIIIVYYIRQSFPELLKFSFHFGPLEKKLLSVTIRYF
jgi:hypothetical protein